MLHFNPRLLFIWYFPSLIVMVTMMTTLSARWIWGHALHGVGTLHRGYDREKDLNLQLGFIMDNVYVLRFVGLLCKWVCNIIEL